MYPVLFTNLTFLVYFVVNHLNNAIYIYIVIDTKVATKDPPSLAQPRAFSTHSSPEGWYERSGASPCSVLTASMAQVTGDPPYTTLAASHTRGFGHEHT